MSCWVCLPVYFVKTCLTNAMSLKENGCHMKFSYETLHTHTKHLNLNLIKKKADVIVTGLVGTGQKLNLMMVVEKKTVYMSEKIRKSPGMIFPVQLL